MTASEDFGAPPESWEVADVDASMRRLMLSSTKNDAVSSDSSSSNRSEKGDVSPSIVVPEDLVNSVDQFLREALQNPRERLSGFFSNFLSLAWICDLYFLLSNFPNCIMF